jgi:hypothetical protein
MGFASLNPSYKSNEETRWFITSGLSYQQPTEGSQYIRGNPVSATS